MKFVSYLKQVSLVYGVMWLVVWYVWYTYLFLSTWSSGSQGTELSYEAVSLWDLKESIDTFWSAELVNEQSIKFNKIGTITKVNFKDGESVKKWDIIAELDNAAWQATVKDAQINVDNAKLSLEQLYKKTSESEILKAQNTIESGQKNIENASKELENLKITQASALKDAKKSIENAKSDLITLKKNYDLAKNDLELQKQNLSSSYNTSVLSRENDIKSIENSFLWEKSSLAKNLDDIDLILGLTEKNRNLNDSYEIYFSAKDTTLKNEAETNFYKASWAYKNFLELLSQYDNTQNIDKIQPIILSLQSTYSALQKAADYSYQAADNSIVASSLSESQLSSMKSTFSSIRSGAESKITSLNSILYKLDTLTDINLLSQTNANTLTSKEESLKTQVQNISKKEDEIENLENNLALTISKQELEMTTKLQSIENLQKTLEINKQSFAELQEGPTKENVAKAENSIEQANIKLQDAIDALKDYKIEAPFDGVVKKIDYKVWDKLLSDTSKYVYIENPNLIQIPISLDQVDVVKVEVGTSANITFDAYPSETLTGSINLIDYTPVKTSWVVTYTAYINIDNTAFDKNILSGMTANIEIITSQKKNVLLVSSSYISTEWQKSFVLLDKNGTLEKTQVEVWTSSNGKTEILSWLQVGDKIALQKVSVSSSSSAQTQNSLFSVPGGNRTWWGNFGWWNGGNFRQAGGGWFGW